MLDLICIFKPSSGQSSLPSYLQRTGSSSISSSQILTIWCTLFSLLLVHTTPICETSLKTVTHFPDLFPELVTPRTLISSCACCIRTSSALIAPKSFKLQFDNYYYCYMFSQYYHLKLLLAFMLYIIDAWYITQQDLYIIFCNRTWA